LLLAADGGMPPSTVRTRSSPAPVPPEVALGGPGAENQPAAPADEQRPRGPSGTWPDARAAMQPWTSAAVRAPPRARLTSRCCVKPNAVYAREPSRHGACGHESDEHRIQKWLRSTDSNREPCG
jgi:hypothetical protein